MRSKLLALIGLVGFAGTASAASYTWQGGDAIDPTAWNDPDNWTGGGGGFPDDSGDEAIIPYVSSYPLIVLGHGNVTIGRLQIQEDLGTPGTAPTLQINSSRNLQVSADHTADFVMEPGSRVTVATGASLRIVPNANLAFSVAGEIELLASGSKLMVGADDSDDVTITFQNGGLIDGQDSAAVVEIPDAGDVFRSLIAIEGQMQFTGPSGATFDNREYVKATSGVIQFDANLVLLDQNNTGIEWIVDGSSGRLKFMEPLNLTGDFDINSGKAFLTNDVTTTGSYADGCSNTFEGTLGAKFTWSAGGPPPAPFCTVVP